MAKRHILVLNCGSSSVKYKVYVATPDGCIQVHRGSVERIGEGASYHERCVDGRMRRDEVEVRNHVEALERIITGLAEQEGERAVRIWAVGHRVVHGGARFTESALVTDDLIAAVEDFCELAPLHNPHNLAGIRAVQNLLPGVPQVAVFDTAFHRTMPPKAYLYAIPYEYYSKHHIQRYGFHGTSYRYVVGRAREMLADQDLPRRMAIFHLGNGCSCAAVRGGRCVTTSMGFTPVEGLVMGTRSGDVDPAMLRYLAGKEGMDIIGVERVLNTQSGLLGVSGLSNDMRVLLEAAEEGHQRARLAIDLFVFRLRRYIGSYTAALEGLDTLAFTGGIGEHAWQIREQACKGFEYLGMKLDEEVNRLAQGGDQIVSAPTSRVRVLTVHTDEEGMIAADTCAVVKALAGEPSRHSQGSQSDPPGPGSARERVGPDGAGCRDT